MEDRANTHASSTLSVLLRAWSTTIRKGQTESKKPEAITLGAYLLPKHMHDNRAEIQGGELCGCIFCEQIFPRSEIERWVAGGNTAICPRCGTASVVGSGAGFELTSELLHRTHQTLFDGQGRRA